MKILKSYKYRIYPNKEQEVLIQKTFGCCRFVYNQTLAYRIELYQTQGKSRLGSISFPHTSKIFKQKLVGRFDH